MILDLPSDQYPHLFQEWKILYSRV